MPFAWTIHCPWCACGKTNAHSATGLKAILLLLPLAYQRCPHCHVRFWRLSKWKVIPYGAALLACLVWIVWFWFSTEGPLLSP